MLVLSPHPHPHPHPPCLLLTPSTGLPLHKSLLFLRPPPSHPAFLCRPFSSYGRTSDSVTHRRLASARIPPPPNQENSRPEGIPTSVSKIRESVQIFLAVLFWISLFFWSSAWDGRNRPSKGPRWR